MFEVQFFVFGLLSFAKIAKFAKISTPKVTSDLFQNNFHQNVDDKLLHSLLLVKLLVLVRLAFPF